MDGICSGRILAWGIQARDFLLLSVPHLQTAGKADENVAHVGVVEPKPTARSSDKQGSLQRRWSLARSLFSSVPLKYPLPRKPVALGRPRPGSESREKRCGSWCASLGARPPSPHGTQCRYTMPGCGGLRIPALGWRSVSQEALAGPQTLQIPGPSRIRDPRFPSRKLLPETGRSPRFTFPSWGALLRSALVRPTASQGGESPDMWRGILRGRGERRRRDRGDINLRDVGVVPCSVSSA
jgi:hypothetical protein